MVFKFVVFCAALAVVNAGYLGAPATIQYSSAPAVSHSYISQPLTAVHAAPVAVHAPAVGASQQSVIRSLGGNQAISTYSKAVDSAFSTVRKYDTRITNNALSVAHDPVAYASPIAHAPVAYASPIAHAPVAYASPIAHALVAYASPIAHAPVTYASPVTHAQVAYASPVAHAPVAYAAPIAHVAPVASYAAGAPVISKSISYSPAAVVAHTSFEGLGAHNEW